MNLKNLELVGAILSFIIFIIFLLWGLYLKGGMKVPMFIIATIALIATAAFGYSYGVALKNEEKFKI